MLIHFVDEPTTRFAIAQEFALTGELMENVVDDRLNTIRRNLPQNLRRRGIPLLLCPD